MVAATFLEGGTKKVLGVEPTYSTVYQYATSVRTDAIKLPLNKDYTQNIGAFITATKRHYRELGFVYLCNPNNPTGLIVTKQEVKQLLDGIPEDMPVLIDEAYYHFVQSADYASVAAVRARRPSGHHLPDLLEDFRHRGHAARLRHRATRSHRASMEPHAMNSINALVKWGGVAGLHDTAGQQKVLDMTFRIRDTAIRNLRAHGYDVLPTETNFFMVSIRREVQPVIDEFRKRSVLVGRAFPPMTQHMRVSVGTDDEMARFMTAFKEIFPAARSSSGA